MIAESAGNDGFYPSITNWCNDLKWTLAVCFSSSIISDTSLVDLIKSSATVKKVPKLVLAACIMRLTIDSLLDIPLCLKIRTIGLIVSWYLALQ